MTVRTFLTAILVTVAFSQAYARSADVGAKPDNKILLRIMDLPSPSGSGVNSQIGRSIVRHFLEENPQYHLEPFQAGSVRGGGNDEGPLMAIATGVPPHGLYVNFRQSSTYINHGFLVPLEDLLARVLSANPTVRETDARGQWKANPTPEEIEEAVQQLRSRVVNPAWPVIYREADADSRGVPPGKHVWALPYATLVRTLVYRKDLFKEAGLDPERPPETWNELLEYSRRIKRIPNKFGFFFQRGPAISWGVYSFMVSNGTEYMRRGDDGVWQAAFNNREAAETIYFLLRLTKEKFSAGDSEYLGAAYAPMGGGKSDMMKWKQGDLGMMMTYLSYDRIQDMNPALIGIAPVPKAPNGKRGSELNCTMMGVFAESSPEQQLGVMRYIWALTGTEARRIRTQTYVDYGYGQFLDPKDLEEFGYHDILRKIPKSYLDTVAICLENGVPEPYGKNTQLIYEKVSEPINWAIEHGELLDLPRERALDKIQEQLDVSATRVNRFMLEQLTPEEMSQRRSIGGLVLLVVIGLFVGSVTYTWRAFTRADREFGRRGSLRKFWYAYLLVLPGLALVLCVQYLPLLLGTPLALYDYQFVGESAFVGLDNFATVLYDARFWTSLGRTFYYVILVVGLGFWPPILLAILLDEVPGEWSKYLFRTVFYLPTIVSGIIMVFLWRQLYEPSEAGFLNQILLMLNHLGPVPSVIVRFLALGLWLSLVGFILLCAVRLSELSWPVRGAVGLFGFCLLGATLHPLLAAYLGPDPLIIEARGLDPAVVSGAAGLWCYIRSFFAPFELEPLRWVEDPGLAMLCTVLPMVWAHAGPGCIIYLAALKTVPEDLVEAATIDGAGIIQKICYITLPRVKILILIQLMGAIVGAFKGGTDFILALTGGGPNGATRTLGMDIFERSFLELRFGIGTSMGWLLGAIVIMITAYQLKRMSQTKFRSAATANLDAPAEK